MRLINIYGPNRDQPNFYSQLRPSIENHQQNYTIICGDLNLVMDPILDTYNYIHVNNPNARNTFIQIMNDNTLLDAFRHFNPQKKRYTWKRRNPIKQARLDYFITSANLTDIIHNCHIKPGYRSDHSVVELNLILSNLKRGPGLWKLNCSLLKNPEYLEMINKTIEDIKKQYMIPIYNVNNLGEIDNSEIQFTIDDTLFLEMLLLKMREKTICFFSCS